MPKFIDLVGKKFNKLTVVERMENASNGAVRWKCLCDCGNYNIVRTANLKNGSVKSCGCLLHDTKNKVIHGMSRTRIYNEWSGIKDRCTNPKSNSAHNYLQRGVKMCDEWKNDFTAFYKWALSSGYKDNLTIERKDVNGDYCPENCCWISLGEQAGNRRTNLSIEYNGKTQNLKEWCDELNLNYKRVHNRMSKLGYSFEEAITKPVMTQKRNKEAKNKYG